MDKNNKKKKKNIPMIVGCCIVITFLIIGIFAEYLAPYDPTITNINVYAKPSKEHLLGTNDVGQDILSELIYGTRVSMIMGITAAAVSTLVGTAFALLSAYYGGIVDKLITGLASIAMAVPGLALTTLLVCYLKPGKISIIIAIAITAWTGTARILRSRIMSLMESPFIKIEKAIGQKDSVIMFKHLIPNIKDTVLSRAAMSVSSAMMAETSLSFLGLGVFAEKSWGAVLRYAFYRNGVIRGLYWWYMPPIICITLAVGGFMLIGYYGLQKR